MEMLKEDKRAANTTINILAPLLILLLIVAGSVFREYILVIYNRIMLIYMLLYWGSERKTSLQLFQLQSLCLSRQKPG